MQNRLSYVCQFTRVYGPYTEKKTGTRFFHVFTKKERRRVAYSRLLVEVLLGRRLEPKREVLDRIDKTISTHSWKNLRIVDHRTRVSEDNKRVQRLEVKCVWCDASLWVRPAVARYRVKIGVAGPFCSQSCVGQFAPVKNTPAVNRQNLQRPLSDYYQWSLYAGAKTVSCSVSKGGDTVEELADKLNINLLSEKELLALLPLRKPRQFRSTMS